MKFAYLIMVHKNIDQIKILLNLLDDTRNDIYLHIDKKSNLKIEDFTDCVRNSKLFCYKKVKVYWGDLSQIKCEIFLLKKAITNDYDYYHLISGNDLPLKSQSEIHNFFSNNKGKEFIHFEELEYSTKVTNYRYNFFFNLICRLGDHGKSGGLKKFLTKQKDLLINFQIKHNICRSNHMCGANWFSITHSLAKKIVRDRRKIIWNMQNMISADEVFLQTYVFKYKLQNQLYQFNKNDDYKSIMRKIDWERGQPYIWRENDFEELILSDYLFARKFDIELDEKIISSISDYLLKK